MGGIENQPQRGRKTEAAEILDPHHFYAAYVFERAEEHQKDIRTLIEQAQRLGYSLRYWWLSDAMDLQGYPDRLIVCVHHPSASEDAGIDLYEALKEKVITWDELDSAVVEEYASLGRRVTRLGELSDPRGQQLFPDDEFHD